MHLKRLSPSPLADRVHIFNIYRFCFLSKDVDFFVSVMMMFGISIVWRKRRVRFFSVTCDSISKPGPHTAKLTQRVFGFTNLFFFSGTQTAKSELHSRKTRVFKRNHLYNAFIWIALIKHTIMLYGFKVPIGQVLQKKLKRRYFFSLDKLQFYLYMYTTLLHYYISYSK